MNRGTLTATAIWACLALLAPVLATGQIATGPDHPAWIKVEKARVRKGPGLQHEIYGTLDAGTKVYVVERDGEWIKVRTPGGHGWVHFELLTDDIQAGRKLAAESGRSATSAPAASSATPAWVKVDEARIRSGPGLSHEIYGKRGKGTKVYVLGRQGDWVKVRTPGGFGWIHYELLTDNVKAGQALAREAGLSAPAAPSPTTGDGNAAWIKTEEARVRSGPGLQHDIYGTRTIGTKVFVVGREGEWAKVKTPGGYGWIRPDLLTDHVPTGRELAQRSGASTSGAVKKAYASGDNLYLREGPGVQHGYRAVLDKGQTIYVTEQKGDWCRVHVKGGNWGWVYAGYVKYDGSGSAHSAGGRPQASPPPVISDFPSPTRQYSGGATLSEATAWVDENRANVRLGPSAEQDVRMLLDRGTKVAVTDVDGHWCKVRLPDGTYGWMAGWVLDFDGPGDEIMANEGGKTVEVKVGWIARSDINLRAGPSTDHDVIGQAALSTEVVILEQQDDWYRVGLDGGREAWVKSSLVDTREQRRERVAQKSYLMGSPGAAPGAWGNGGGSGTGADLVSIAMQRLGDRYVRGTSGEGGSFDCSGFTSWVHRQKGIRISRSSIAQYRQGAPISRGNLQKGDCVFFRNTYRAGISHVGIYLGDGRFIHAANSRRGVVIDHLNDNYYAPRYAGAKRMR